MQHVEALLASFEDFRQAQRFTQAPEQLYAPVNYIMDLGGKRMRPLLVLLACQLFDDDTQQALPAALCVEIFHNFSLVHDDIMDAAPLRRGKATVHQRFGLNAGILSGDVMLIHAYNFLLQTPRAAAIPALVQTLTKVAIEVCEGQQYDMDFETMPFVSLEDYLHMIELKTAVLLAGSLAMGAIAAGAPREDQQHLAEFGRLTGIAFQLQDDYLDAFGDAALVGKQAGGDIVQNKKTCLYIKALELAAPPVRARLQTLMSQSPENPKDKVEEVLAIFQYLGIPNFVKSLKNDYQNQAWQHLEAVNVPPERKKPLIALAESLLLRQM